MENLEFERICPVHQKPLKNFKGIGKASGKPYENWKCTFKDGSGAYCTYIEWVDQTEETPKFTQTPDGVIEISEPFGQPTLQDIMALLGRINAKLNRLLNDNGTEEK